MALQTQTTFFPFASGPDTKSDPKLVPPGKLLSLQNGFFYTPGELRKRYGYTSLGTSTLQGGTVIKGALCQAYSSELVTSDGSYLYSYDQGLNVQNQIGTFVPMKISVNPISVVNSPSQTEQTYQDSVYDSASGLYCYVWIDNTNFAYYSVVEAATGQAVIQAKILTGAGHMNMVKLQLFQGKFVFVYWQVNSGTLVYRTVSTSAPTTVSAETTLASALLMNQTAANANFDCLVQGNRLYVAYNQIATSAGVSFFYLDSSFTQSAVTANGSHNANGAVGLWGDGTNVWAAFSDNSAVYGLAYNANLSSLTSSLTTLQTIGSITQVTGVTLGSVGYALYSAYANHSTTNVIRLTTFAGGGTGVSGVVWKRSVSLLSKAFVYNGNFFVLGLYGGPTSGGQPTVFVLAGTTAAGGANTVGRFASQVAYDNFHGQMLPEVSAVSSGVFSVPYAQQAGVNEFAVWSATYQAILDMTVTPQAQTIAGTLHLTGGQLWAYDGSQVVEHGFHLFPDNMSAVQTGTGNVLTGGGAYSYIAVFEWIDGKGQLHRSQPSLPLAMTANGSGGTGGPSSTTVTVSTLRCTQKSNVQVLLYRTAAGGTIYYLAGLLPGWSLVTADTVTIVDATSDANLVRNVELYTTSGEVENSSAPPVGSICTYKSRLIVIPSDSGYSWWYSKDVIPNSAATVANPVELSEFAIQNISPIGGPLVTGLQMDDKLILFKSSAIGYTLGDGPSVNGSGNDYIDWQIIASDIGIKSAASALLTPVGIMFQSVKGFCLLGRDLSVNDKVGEGVAAYVSETVLSATLVPYLSQARFVMSGGETLVWDYYVNQWSVFTTPAGVQACLWNGAYTYVQSSGQALQESSSVFTDAGQAYALKIQTSWLAFAGVQGYQRVRRAAVLGDWRSTHTLQVQVAYDYDPTVKQTTNVVTSSAVVPYQWRLFFDRQKCEAVQLTIQDTGSTGEAMALSGLAFEVGVAGGLVRLPSSQSNG